MVDCAPAVHQPVVAFVVDGRRWALALDAVERVVAMVAVDALPSSPDGVVGVVNVHGDAVPVLDLGARYGLPPHPCGPDAQLLLARTSRRRVAVPIDEALGVLEAGTTAVDAAAPPVAGVAALADGLLVIHDLDAFLTSEQEDRLAHALADAT
jgi:purine-binding chemotaxis protein CheW